MNQTQQPDRQEHLLHFRCGDDVAEMVRRGTKRHGSASAFLRTCVKLYEQHTRPGAVKTR